MRARTSQARQLLQAGVCQQFMSSSQRPQHICASCRAIVATTSRPSPSTQVLPALPSHFTQTRSYTNSKSEANTSQQEVVVPETHYDFFPQTFPDGPPPKAPFTPDLKQLRREFLQLQAKAHPDLAPQDQKRHAEALSMRINEAYKTLQDPLRRAQYLLSRHDIDTEDESAKLSDSELLMEVMEAREAVDEVEEESELGGLRTENDERVRESVRILEEAFAQNDLQRAAQETIRLRYWVNIDQSIIGWEKGQGGGPVHHE